MGNSALSLKWNKWGGLTPSPFSPNILLNILGSDPIYCFTFQSSLTLLVAPSISFPWGGSALGSRLIALTPWLDSVVPSEPQTLVSLCAQLSGRFEVAQTTG